MLWEKIDKEDSQEITSEKARKSSSSRMNDLLLVQIQCVKQNFCLRKEISNYGKVLKSCYTVKINVISVEGKK